ncbi:hypothetical protein [Spirosoma areae]
MHLENQAGVNGDMVYFELDPYWDLPESVDLNLKPDYQSKKFTSHEDSMSPTIPARSTFSGLLLDEAEYETTRGVVCIFYRSSWRTPREITVGRAAHIDQNGIYLIHDQVKLDSTDPNWMYIPIPMIVFMYKVQTITLTLPIQL